MYYILQKQSKTQFELQPFLVMTLVEQNRLVICCHVDHNFADKYSVIEPVSMLTNCTLITDRLKVLSGCRTVLKLCTLENKDVGHNRKAAMVTLHVKSAIVFPITVIVNHPHGPGVLSGCHRLHQYQPTVPMAYPGVISLCKMPPLTPDNELTHEQCDLRPVM